MGSSVHAAASKESGAGSRAEKDVDLHLYLQGPVLLGPDGSSAVGETFTNTHLYLHSTLPIACMFIADEQQLEQSA